MTPRQKTYKHFGGHRTIITVILCLLGLCLSQNVQAQRKKHSKPEDTRIYLDHADSLYYDEYKRHDTQIVRGHVKFRHQGATLYCDSAYFRQQENTFNAFGHVRMLQADTLEVRCDTAFYDGRADAFHEIWNYIANMESNYTNAYKQYEEIKKAIRKSELPPAQYEQLIQKIADILGI